MIAVHDQIAVHGRPTARPALGLALLISLDLWVLLAAAALLAWRAAHP
ncbi:hypothetical protein [Plastoroseomonas hellenica]|nr:hypothetical protein [Plastoroseomonas hellenica]MBR0646810.1 hypothetical protein [Plastoroseomonas hellenica]